MTIKVLESRVISQIAAGEVVERPASVVKELLENSLDAGSSQISIEIKNGGSSLIRVIDNGTGIHDQETELAFERHATSKIRALDDLETLSSLGFRGEALPSIASVADIEVLTAPEGAAGGTHLLLEDGKVIKHESQARSRGTTISVSNLFRRIPARLKFLKSPSTEAGRIATVVSQYTLAYPEIKFTLITDGRTALRSTGSGKLIDAVHAVYGEDIAANMLELKQSEEVWKTARSHIVVSGMVGTPHIARSSRDYISLFVNRRCISSRVLGFAIEEAYHGLLMQGKHPLAVIDIRIPPNLIDVNIHPAKTEIKFIDEHMVFSAVQRTVREALVRSTPVPGVEETTPHFVVPAEAFTGVAPIPRTPVLQQPGQAPQSILKQEPVTPLISLPLLRVLGQLARNYIVAEGPDGLYLIDQHAAHERIMFERIKDQKARSKVESQGLLEAAAFEVEPRQVMLLNSRIPVLVQFGFDLEAFGDRTYLVRSIPASLCDRDWAAALRESLESSSDSWTESLVTTLACHSAIRAGQVLNETEMRELVKQLEQTALPNTCPHGRPTIIRMTIQRLEKEFGRS